MCYSMHAHRLAKVMFAVPWNLRQGPQCDCRFRLELHQNWWKAAADKYTNRIRITLSGQWRKLAHSSSFGSLRRGGPLKWASWAADENSFAYSQWYELDETHSPLRWISCMMSGTRVTMPAPRGRKSLPTIFSRTELFPLLCPMG